MSLPELVSGPVLYVDLTSRDVTHGRDERPKPWRAFWIHEPTEIFLARTWLEAVACLYAVVGNGYGPGELKSGELDLNDNTLQDEDGRGLTIAEWIEETKPTEPFQIGTQYT